jgi:hypothetical protein
MLSKKHQSELKSSGIDTETAELLGIRTEYDLVTIAAMLCRPTVTPNFAPALVFPFGQSYFRVKPAVPPENGQKYLSPTGIRQRAYFPFDKLMREDIRSLSIPIFITEGEKKSIRATLGGFPTIGLCGVYGWKTKDKEDLIPELKDFHWWNRRVYIVFDSDAITNKLVLGAEKRLAHVLTQLGAEVHVIRIPENENSDHKVGLDDFLEENGNDIFAELISKSRKLSIRTEDQPLPVVSMHDVIAQDVEWLWHGRIPYSSLTMLSGDPGKGKSQIICDIAARLSNAQSMPPRRRKLSNHLPSRSLIIASEDHAAKVIKPRLLACKANLKFVDVVSDAIVSFPEKLGQFRALIMERGYEFVAFDPITSCIHERFNSNIKGSVRGVLFELSKIAEESGAAFLMLRHYSKSSAASQNALYRGMGSINWSAAVRSELAVEGPIDGTYYLMTLKSSYSEIKKAVGYRIADCREHGTSKISWAGYDSRTADELIYESRGVKGRKKKELTIAIEDYLLECRCSVPFKDLIEHFVDELGYEKSSFERAKRSPLFKSARNPFTNRWELSLKGRKFSWEGATPKRVREGSREVKRRP